MRTQDAILIGLWSGVVIAGAWLQPFIGLVLAAAVLGTYTWVRWEEHERSAVEEQLAAMESGIQSKLDSHSAKLDELVGKFVALRTDEAVHRGLANVSPRLRG